MNTLRRIFVWVATETDQPRSEVEDYGNCTNFYSELLSASAHTLPPMKLLCSSFILSLMGQQSSRNRLKNAESSRDSKGDSSKDDISHLNDNEVSRPAKSAITPINENEDTDESSAQLISHDWSFLSIVLPDENNIVH